MMFRKLFCQRLKITDVEGEQYPPLCCRAEQLRPIIRIGVDPLVRGARHIVAALPQRVENGFDGGVGIKMKAGINHPESPARIRI